MKKIIVAGCGHGGLITAAILAKNGFDVIVIEQKKRKQLGYDWTDIFDLNTLKSVGIPIPKKKQYPLKENMTFYTPTLRCKRKPIVPEEQKEVKIERKELYKILINYAKKCGVKMIFGKKIVKSICKNNRVVGIETVDNKIYGDLVIDACGVNSIVRKTLNSDYGIEQEINEKFYVYRAFYNKIKNTKTRDKYKIYILPRNEKGISWVAIEKDCVDVLIGRFYPINQKIVDNELEWLRHNNRIGNIRIRGGQFVEIPIRRPLSQLVYNGYAAIGDSAFMTIPLMGSGIALCAKAAKILAKVIIKNKESSFEIQDLWSYQVSFYKKYGYDLAYKDVLKNLFINMDIKDIDYVFENNVINDDILIEITNDQKIKVGPKTVITQGKHGVTNPKLLVKLGNTLLNCRKISRLCKNIPVEYSKEEVDKWKEKYLKIKPE